MNTDLLLQRGTAALAPDRLTRNVMRPARTALSTGNNDSKSRVASFSSLMSVSGSAAASTASTQQAGVAGAASPVVSNTATQLRSSPVKQNVTVVHSPVGAYVINESSDAGTTAVKAWEPESEYFFTHSPEEYRDDPQKMAEFEEIYGPQALAVFKHFNTVPENQIWGLDSTDEQKAFFRADGVRVSYSVIELINMDRDERNKWVDITTDKLHALYWSGNYELRFQTKPSAVVGA
jgi:hypothetical protein